MKSKLAGFTLVEMMIVVAIVAILASLAVPSYQRYVRESRRAEALTSVQRVAALEEQFYFANGRYTDNAANELGGISPTPGGFYNVAVVLPAAPAVGFTVTATAIGTQAADHECETISLNNAATRDATGTMGDQTRCWRN